MGAKAPNSFGATTVKDNMIYISDPKTKEEWREVLEFIYQCWLHSKTNNISVYPPGRAKSILHLDGYVGINQIGRIQ
jgi:hypothetical protein